MSEPSGDKQMTFWEHLDELRTRLRRALFAVVIGAGVAWFFKEQILGVLLVPFQAAWVEQKLPGTPMLHFAAPSDAFMAYVRQSVIAGLVLSAPVVFWELWAFVAPGLYAKEKKSTLLFVVFSTLLFVGGGLFGWKVAFPVAFNYFLGMAGDVGQFGVGIAPTVMMADYLDFVGKLLLAFGAIFELPLLLLALSIAGIINYLQMWHFGRWFILIAFTVGAILSPPDVTSQVIMSVPLVALYFLSIGLAFLFGKRPTPEQIEAYRRKKAKR
ncbi:MAG TPA: twin-arginine translocase subunit TatC [Polyangiaceae bacterium]|nr:twin-arginine translocase subunit TatC [Polyangiaceae bacterium]